jgi:hypothetical protein
MQCQVKNADKTPCSNEAETTAIIDGFRQHVCNHHNTIMSRAIQQNKKYRPGQSGLFQKHDGTEFKERRRR